MVNLRYWTFLLVAPLFFAFPALAKDETLADRGMRMCEEAGVPLAECTILPPKDRTLGQTRAAIASPGPKTFGTGKYGWCEDCTSLLAAAPVQPWSDFGGNQFSSQRDEDDNPTLAEAGTEGDIDGGGDGEDGDGGGEDGDGGGGEDGDGDGGGEDGDGDGGGEDGDGDAC